MSSVKLSAIGDSRLVTGGFPRTAEPRVIAVRRGPSGDVMNYQTYAPDGLPLKRVDVTGRSHGGVKTPHVVEFEQHVNPVTGEVFEQPRSTVRPATPEELMGLE
ncbi:polymorphic toxin type 24 domain-containing protein [Cellulomonas sp. NPDC058312]|uniref:polymorphic toxin type 24 domain-containing protein n=1 Tax=Cellulomonas sp. NPDC058312 TaxID=3346441 RepID=UPI0036EA78E8